MAYMTPLPNIMEAVQGVRYPCDAETLLQKAEQNGAARTTLKLLARLPDRSYRNVSEINHALGEIEQGLPSDQKFWAKEGPSSETYYRKSDKKTFSRYFDQDLE